jgi:ribose-phosphate pyrophosphokinase
MYGDVEGKQVLVFDDFINAGSTVETSAEVLKKNGAKSVHFFATHGIFANNGQERVQKSQIDTVIVTNSIPQEVKVEKLKVLSVSSIFSDALSSWMPQAL